MQKKQNTLRIAHYNILYGGEERLDLILKIIKEINPDICGILEAVGWENKKSDLENKGSVLGYAFFYLAKANSKHNIAIFSKIPLKIEEIKGQIRNLVVKTTLKEGPYKDLAIFFVHFSPKSEDDRLLEVGELSKNVPKSSPIILMGDFNSLSRNDPYNNKELIEIFQKNNLNKYGTDALRFDTISKIESLGFIDAATYLKYPFIATSPTPSNKDSNHPANVRIDYAFLNKNIVDNLKKMEITVNNDTNKASDHYPLFIDLQK